MTRLELADADRKLIDDGKTMRPLLDALGELIIVGKPVITFRNREIVATKPQPSTPPTTATTTPVIGAPTVTGFPPNAHAAKSKITISGTNFLPGT